MVFFKIPMRNSSEWEKMYDFIVVEMKSADELDDVLSATLYDVFGEFDDDQPEHWQPQQLTLEQALASGWPISATLCISAKKTSSKPDRHVCPRKSPDKPGLFYVSGQGRAQGQGLGMRP